MENYDDFIKEHLSRDYTREELLEVVKKVAATHNPYLICDLCEYDDRLDDPEFMPILQKALEETGDIMHIYEFAFLMCDCNKKYVDFKSLQDKIVAEGNAKLLCYCREYVPAFDKRELDKAFIKDCGPKWILNYIKAYNADPYTDPEEDRITRNELEAEKNFWYGGTDVNMRGKYWPPALRRFEQEKAPYAIIPGREGRQIIVSSGDPYVIGEYAEHVAAGSEDLSPYEDAMIATGDVLYVYEMGASVEGVNMKKIEDAVIASGMPKYIYYVGAYCPGADTDRMLSELKKLGNKKYIGLMEEHIAEAKKE